MAIEGCPTCGGTGMSGRNGSATECWCESEIVALGSAGQPLYWMGEATVVLRPVVERFLKGNDPDHWDARLLKAYIAQWVLGISAKGKETYGSPHFRCMPDELWLPRLAAATSWKDFNEVVQILLEHGLDPL